MGKGKPKTTRRQVRHNALFRVNEGEALLKLLEVSGSPLGAELRNTFDGDVLGQQNASKDYRRVVGGGTYSFGLVAVFQPEYATALIDQHRGNGLPQRFLWSAAADTNMPQDRPGHPGPLDELRTWLGHARPGTLQGSVVLATPAEVQAELDAEIVARHRGEIVLDELDKHRPLMLLKVSAVLALLDGRAAVDADDWRLARIVWETSCAVRDAITASEEARRYREAKAKVDRRVAEAVQVASATAEADAAVRRIALWGGPQGARGC